MWRRIPALIVASLLVLLPGAPAAMADGATAAEKAAVLQAGDLAAGSQATLSAIDFSTAGDSPSACGLTSRTRPALGTPSARAVFRYAEARPWAWESAVYVYPSETRAQASFARLKTAAESRCRPIGHSAEMEEGYTTAMLMGEVVVGLKAKAGMPRFAIDTFLVGRSDGADVDPLDRYGYTVFYRAGRTVVRLSATSYLPLTPKDPEMIRDTALLLAQRAATIG